MVPREKLKWPLTHISKGNLLGYLLDAPYIRNTASEKKNF